MKPLSRKITVRMFVIYVSLYFATLLTIIVLVWPGQIIQADNNAKKTISLMAGEIENIRNMASEYSQSILYSQQIIDYLKAFDEEPSERNEALINQALSNFVIANSTIYTVSLEDFEGNYFYSMYYTNVCNRESALAQPEYQRLKETKTGSYYLYIPPETFVAEGVDYRYHALEYTQVIRLDQKSYIFRIYAGLNTAINHLAILSENIFSDIAILYADGATVYTSGKRFFEDSSGLKDRFPYHLTQGKQNTLSGVYFYQKNISTGWTLLAFSPLYYYASTLLGIILIVTVLYVLSAVIYALFLVFTIRRFLLPLEQLNLAMQEYSVGEEVHTDIHTQDEIEKLNECFINMTKNINRQVDDIKEQEHINSVVNYKLLATQIDPHFIYNTMNIINIMAREGNTTAIVEINSALIKILRERLNSKLSITDTIENERATLYQYSRIMDYRYENRIRLTLDADNDLLQYQIPKNILQPLAENSFYHGFSSLTDGQEGHIDILIYSINDELILEISDDGAGISPERLEILRNHSYEIYNDKRPHIGLDNIRQRLAFMYGNHYQFDIQSTLGYGTTISITIPLQK